MPGPRPAPASASTLARAFASALAFASAFALAFALPSPARAADDALFSLSGQATVGIQAHPGFAAAYSGKNSLRPDAESATSIVLDLGLSVTPWPGAQLFVQPEVSGGAGLSPTLGVAAFPSGEVYRVGDPSPTIYLARVLLKQTLALPWKDSSLTLLGGKFGVNEVFDKSTTCDDPHTGFSSWGLWASAAYDYPADVRGYTVGLAAELRLGDSSLRAGLFLEPTEANGAVLQLDVTQARGLVVEGERRFTWGGRRGAVRALAFLDRAPMGSWSEASALATPDVVATRGPTRSKGGFAASADLELIAGLAAFARASWSDGANESWAFTQVDHSLALGATLTGARWTRSQDALGLALVASGLSPAQRGYLARGGTGFLLGDGALRYGPEVLGELFYRAQLNGLLSAVGAVQPIFNPACNRDRGPAWVFTLRVHAGF